MSATRVTQSAKYAITIVKEIIKPFDDRWDTFDIHYDNESTTINITFNPDVAHTLVHALTNANLNPQTKEKKNNDGNRTLVEITLANSDINQLTAAEIAHIKTDCANILSEQYFQKAENLFNNKFTKNDIHLAAHFYASAHKYGHANARDKFSEFIQRGNKIREELDSNSNIDDATREKSTELMMANYEAAMKLNPESVKTIAANFNERARENDLNAENSSQQRYSAAAIDYRKKAIQFYQRAKTLGYPYSDAVIGQCKAAFAFELLVTNYNRQAVTIFDEALEIMKQKAFHALLQTTAKFQAALYAKGIELMESNDPDIKNQGIECISKAIEYSTLTGATVVADNDKTNIGRAFFVKGRKLEIARKYGEALKYYEQAIDLGQSGANTYAGNLYLDTNLGPLRNETRGIALLTTAADSGDSSAQYTLAKKYHDYFHFHQDRRHAKNAVKYLELLLNNNSFSTNNSEQSMQKKAEAGKLLAQYKQIPDLMNQIQTLLPGVQIRIQTHDKVQEIKDFKDAKFGHIELFFNTHAECASAKNKLYSHILNYPFGWARSYDRFILDWSPELTRELSSKCIWSEVQASLPEDLPPAFPAATRSLSTSAILSSLCSGGVSFAAPTNPDQSPAKVPPATPTLSVSDQTAPTMLTVVTQEHAATSSTDTIATSVTAAIEDDTRNCRNPGF